MGRGLQGGSFSFGPYHLPTSWIAKVRTLTVVGACCAHMITKVKDTVENGGN